jgi:hypothetical protein
MEQQCSTTMRQQCDTRMEQECSTIMDTRYILVGNEHKINNKTKMVRKCH